MSGPSTRKKGKAARIGLRFSPVAFGNGAYANRVNTPCSHGQGEPALLPPRCLFGTRGPTGAWCVCVKKRHDIGTCVLSLYIRCVQNAPPQKCDKARVVERVDGRRGGFGVWRGEIVKHGRDNQPTRSFCLRGVCLLAFAIRKLCVQCGRRRRRRGQPIVQHV
jgi:hypothetical protein